jgi:predicted transcriptional regulator
MGKSRDQAVSMIRKQQRSDFQIIAAILNACSERTRTKYQLMLHTGLNTSTFDKYIDVILKAGLASLIGMDSFFISEKGGEFLKYRGIVESLLGG